MTSVILSIPFMSSLFRNESQFGGRFYGGANAGTTMYFESDYVNITRIDFRGMTKPDSTDIATIRNTTTRKDGFFEISIYNSNNEIIGYKKITLNRNSTKSITNLGYFDFTASTISKINWKATTSGANVSMDVDHEDDTTHFTMTQTRNLVLTHVVSGSSVDLSWDGTVGKNYRVVERIENSYRNMPDASDVVLDTISGGISTTITGLVTGVSTRIVVQQFGTEWYDIQQADITVTGVSLTTVQVGSTFVKCSWDNYGDGSVYTLTVTSDSHSTSVTTTDLEATVQNLLPSNSYAIELSVV